MPDLLALAERVVVARHELAAAEAEFRSATEPARDAARKAHTLADRKVPRETATVTSRLRAFLETGRPRQWSEIVNHLGFDNTGAARAAVKKMRGAGTVSFEDSMYTWIGPR